LFAAGGALACGFSVFGMDRATFDREVLAWGNSVEIISDFSICSEEAYKEAQAHFDTFNPNILKKVLREELKDDAHACKAFDLFHSYRLFEFIDHIKLKSANMTAINAGKFRELMIAIAPIMDCFKYETPKAEAYLNGIIEFVGGNPKAIRAADLKFPQFCFEMLMRIHLEMDARVIYLPDGCVTDNYAALSQAFKCVCWDVFGDSSNWDSKCAEGDIFDYCSCLSEDEGGSCHLWDVWTNWSKKAE
jgi:hypothetical protein